MIWNADIFTYIPIINMYVYIANYKWFLSKLNKTILKSTLYISQNNWTNLVSMALKGKKTKITFNVTLIGIDKDMCVCVCVSCEIWL